MPQGYGYSGGRGGYGRPAYQYDNRQPAAFQYQSFYDPIPVESLIGSSQRSAQEYDLAYAGALAAQDELAQQMVGMQDIAGKTDLINKSISNMNATVKDKYGGDWGRAAKDIAAQVTQARSDPYWNMAKEADRQRKVIEEMKIKHGTDLFVFNDPTKRSILDDEGKLRGYEDFIPDVTVKGDYAQTAREIMSIVHADAGAYGLTKVEAEGLEHYLQTGSYEKISKEKIDEIAKDPAVQNLFLGRHAEIRRGIAELDEAQQRQHGLFGKTPEQFAYEQLYGAGRPGVYTERDLKYTVDQLALKSGTTTPQGVRPTSRRSSVVGVDYEGKPPEVKFDPVTGAVLGAGERQNVAAEIAGGFTGAGAGPMGGGTGLQPEKTSLDYTKEAEADMKIISDIRGNYPSMSSNQYSDQDIFTMKQTADEKMSQTSSNIYNWGGDWSDPATDMYVWDGSTQGIMFDHEVFLDNQRYSGTNKKSEFAKDLGYKPGSKEFEDAFKKVRISGLSFVGNVPGSFTSTITDADGNDHTIESGSSNELSQVTAPAWMIGEAIRTGGMSEKLFNYEATGGRRAFKDEDGNLFIPSGGNINVDGEEGYMYYHVVSDIKQTPGVADVDGTYDTKIIPIVFKDEKNRKDPIYSDDFYTLSDIVAHTRERATEFMTENKNRKEAVLGTGK
jgi:hypothetical protein